MRCSLRGGEGISKVRGQAQLMVGVAKSRRESRLLLMQRRLLASASLHSDGRPADLPAHALLVLEERLEDHQAAGLLDPGADVTELAVFILLLVETTCSRLLHRPSLGRTRPASRFGWRSRTRTTAQRGRRFAGPSPDPPGTRGALKDGAITLRSEIGRASIYWFRKPSQGSVAALTTSSAISPRAAPRGARSSTTGAIANS
jgi:hypothetical protein